MLAKNNGMGAIPIEKICAPVHTEGRPQASAASCLRNVPSLECFCSWLCSQPGSRLPYHNRVGRGLNMKVHYQEFGIHIALIM